MPLPHQLRLPPQGRPATCSSGVYGTEFIPQGSTWVPWVPVSTRSVAAPGSMGQSSFPRGAHGSLGYHIVFWTTTISRQLSHGTVLVWSDVRRCGLLCSEKCHCKERRSCPGGISGPTNQKNCFLGKSNAPARKAAVGPMCYKAGEKNGKQERETRSDGEHDRRNFFCAEHQTIQSRALR